MEAVSYSATAFATTTPASDCMRSSYCCGVNGVEGYGDCFSKDY